MDLAANKALVRQFYEQAINARDLDAVDALLTPDFVHNGERRGSEGQRQAVATLLAAFPDLRVSVDDLVAEGDAVAARCTWQGTQNGPFMGRPANGTRVTFQAIGILRVEAGRIAEAWLQEDDLGLMRQFGARPEAASIE